MKTTFTYLLLLFSTLSISQTPNLDWSKIYGGSGTDMAFKTISLADGHFLIFGNTGSNNGDFTDNDGGAEIFAMKTNPTGEIIWSKTYGGTGNEYFRDVLLLNQDSFLIVGGSSSNNGDVAGNYGLGDVWLLEINAEGSIIWNKNYGDSEVDNGFSAIPTDDGGFIVVGDQRNNVDYMRDGFVFKINAAKEVVWEKTFGGSKNDYFTNIQKKSNGNYLTFGYTFSNDGDISDLKGSSDLWVTEIDGDGNLIWSKTYGGTQLDHVEGVTQDNAGHFLIAGYTSSTDYDITDNDGGSDAWIMKLDQNGEIIWSKTFGGAQYDYAYSIIPLSQGGYMVTGNSESSDGDLTNNKGETDLWLFQLSDDGDLIWQSNYGGSLSEQANSIFQNEESIYVTGFSYSNDGDLTENAGDADIWFLKFNFTDLGLNQISKNSLQIYPNPVRDILNIQSDENLKQIEIYDLTGKLIQTYKISEKSIQLNVEQLNKGVYVVKIITESSSVSKKIIK